MDKKLVDAINEQIKNELYSGYMYLAMAAYFDSINLAGFGKWMKEQAKEEYKHAMKFYDYLNDRGEKVVLKAIDQPPAKYKSPLEVFEKTLAHEKKVTSLINKLCDLAEKAKDRPTQVLLNWYIEEQVEEEDSASSVLEQIKMVKADSPAMLMLDKAMAKRAEK